MSEQKPPLGLTPKFVWDTMRINDILNAMERYSYANKPIPVEWINELKSLTIKEADNEQTTD